MDKKICFVAMGFGRKMDYQNSKEIDLDLIYNKVVKCLFEEELINYKLIRADEISGSSVIDVGMYALLLNADLVIADITTLNPNAIYELGVRHAVKPFSTVIMAQKSCKIPFDLDHSRFLIYNDFGETLDDAEAAIIKQKLLSFVTESEKQQIDSPLYTYFPNTIPPKIDKKEYLSIISNAEDKTDTISNYLTNAQELMRLNEFLNAINLWEKLKDLLPNNDYIIQQLALATYKSCYPNKTKALENALIIIRSLNPDSSLDLETLGITGAIYKRLFKINKNYDYLDEAIKYYQKGFMITSDFYNGENYANCLLFKCEKEDILEEEVIYLRFEARKVYKKIIEIIELNLKVEESNIWMYATLAVSYFVLSDMVQYEKYREIFFSKCETNWQRNTFLDTIKDLTDLVLKSKGE